MFPLSVTLLTTLLPGRCGVVLISLFVMSPRGRPVMNPVILLMVIRVQTRGLPLLLMARRRLILLDGQPRGRVMTWDVAVASIIVKVVVRLLRWSH